MASYQGLVTPPVFWPMLLFLDAGASGRAGLPTQGIAPIEEAIALLGGDPDATLLPELLLLKGDLLAAPETSGGAVPSDAESAYQDALEGPPPRGTDVGAARRHQAVPVLLGDQGDQRVHDLRSILDTFTEGFETVDLLERVRRWRRRPPVDRTRSAPRPRGRGRIVGRPLPARDVSGTRPFVTEDSGPRSPGRCIVTVSRVGAGVVSA